jgi:hypothetical protein
MSSERKMYDFSSLIGKTIESVDQYISEYVPGMTCLTIKFTDGDELELESRGCDEGGWFYPTGTKYDL